MLCPLHLYHLQTAQVRAGIDDTNQGMLAVVCCCEDTSTVLHLELVACKLFGVWLLQWPL